MRLIVEITSRITWILGFLVSVVSKLSPIIDDSISIVAGLIGIVAGLIWASVLLTKRKTGKLEYENEKLENEIKKAELKRLQDES